MDEGLDSTDPYAASQQQETPGPKTRRLGVNPPKRRVDEFLLRERKRLEKEGFSDDEVQALVERSLSEQQVRDERFLKEFLRTAPISRAVPRDGINHVLEAGAGLRVPEVAWLKNLFSSHEGSGRAAADISMAVIFSIALEGGPPNFSRRFKAFEGSNPLRSFAYDYPSMSKQKAAFAAWQSAAKRSSPDAIWHVNVKLLQDLAAIVEDPHDSNHLKVGECLVVDGTFQQADIPQRGAIDEEHSALLRGDYEGTAFMRNITKEGKVTKEVNGYNIVALFDMATGLPVIWYPYPGNVDERKAALELLEMLFFIWPDCPAECLVGDALYDHSEQFARDLERIWDIHPVFPAHGSRSKTTSKFAGTDGVPRCRHSDDGYMKREADDNFFAGLRGVKNGSPRGGDPPNLEARIKWVCPTGECVPPRVTTRPYDDPRRHTYHPQRGHHRLAFRRRVLLARRNDGESGFSSPRAWYLFGVSPCRVRYAKSLKAAQIAFGLAFLGFTIRRLVHANVELTRLFGHLKAFV